MMINQVLRKFSPQQYATIQQAHERLAAATARETAPKPVHRETGAKIGRPEYTSLKNALRKEAKMNWQLDGERWRAMRGAAILRANAKENVICSFCDARNILKKFRNKSFDNTHCGNCLASLGVEPTVDEKRRRDSFRRTHRMDTLNSFNW